MEAQTQTRHKHNGAKAEKHWHNPADLTDIEYALDHSMLFVAITGGKWWQARRNGKTKTWVTRAGYYSIPIKYGFKGCGKIDQDYPRNWLRVAGCREDAERAY